jgi:hypothetical protein
MFIKPGTVFANVGDEFFPGDPESFLRGLPDRKNVAKHSETTHQDVSNSIRRNNREGGQYKNSRAAHEERLHDSKRKYSTQRPREERKPRNGSKGGKEARFKEEMQHGGATEKNGSKGGKEAGNAPQYGSTIQQRR